jgi:ABC-type spermidine/putrescine transport system permease subunit I
VPADGSDSAGREAASGRSCRPRSDGGRIGSSTATDAADAGGVAALLARLPALNARTRDGLLAAGPLALAVGFGVLPLLVLFVESFAPGVTLANYADAFRPLYRNILFRSLALGLVATAACLLVAYPVTYWLAHRCPPRYRLGVLVSLVLPLWLNYIVLNYTWREVLARGGVLNLALLRLGVIAEPLSLLNTRFAVLVGFLYLYLPYVLLTMYVSMERLDGRLLDAARDLGAGDLRVFRDVVLPQTIAGAVAAALIVYARIAGAYATPEILGGPGVQMVSRLIYDQFYRTLDWPFAAALAFVFLGVVVVGFALGSLSPSVRRELKRW